MLNQLNQVHILLSSECSCCARVTTAEKILTTRGCLPDAKWGLGVWWRPSCQASPSSPPSPSPPPLFMAGCLPLLVAAASFGGAPHPAAGHPLATLELLLAPVSVALTPPPGSRLSARFSSLPSSCTEGSLFLTFCKSQHDSLQFQLVT